MIRRTYKLYILLSILTVLVACGSRDARMVLDEIEPMVLTNSDSALHCLAQMPIPSDPKQRARYQLFSTWAHYRHYDEQIDTLALSEAFDYFHRSKDPLRRAQAYYLHSVIRQDQGLGNAEEWTRDLLEASKAIERTTDHVLAGQIYQRLASTMNARHLFRDALSWGEKSRHEAQQAGNTGEEVVALLNMAISQAWMVDSIRQVNDSEMVYTEAINLSLEALALSRQHHIDDGELRSLSKLSSFHSRSQQPDSALYYALLALDLQRRQDLFYHRAEVRSHQSVSDAYRKLGVRYRNEYDRTGNPDKLALAQQMADSVFFHSGIDFCHPNMGIRLTACQLYYITYRDVLHNSDSALYYMTLHGQIKDSLDNEMQRREVIALPFLMEKEEAEASLLLVRHRLVWAVVSGILLLFVGLVFIFNMRRRYRRQLIDLQKSINAMLAAPALETEVSVIQSDKKPVADIVAMESTIEETATEAIVEPSTPQPSTIIRLEGTTNESLTVMPQDIVYITSEGNYVRITYLDAERKACIKMLRATMKQIETVLMPYRFIVRSHRAFLVNIHYISRATNTSAGLALYLTVSGLSIPVSRSCVDRIKEAIRQ